MKNGNSRYPSLKKRVAREAALLLYTSQEKEYKQAKKRATENLGARILPSNSDVARELDAIAEEREGASRNKRLNQMRREALKIMQKLKNHNPRLVGSLWRGTINRNSDIDIVAFAFTPNAVLAQLQKDSFSIAKTERVSVTKKGRKETSFHIYLMLPSGNEAEVVVRPLEKMNHHEKCEIYGDMVTGLSVLQLAKVLKENPLARFIP
ncbi:MAG: nucleotidyltransferase domain-containing protein [Candidatus Bathyarchaeota archaeon]|nr:nucleotidyltransferase domain-containing protein [Candidatus Bathyarchaeota archaeon]